jgi:hypothetical protein
MTKRFGVLIALWISLAWAGSLSAQTTDNIDGSDQQLFLPMVMPDERTAEDRTVTAKQVVRIYLSDHGQLHELAHEIDLFEETTTGGYAVGLASADEIAHLRSQGLRVEVDAVRSAALDEQIAQVAAAQASGVAAINTIPGYSCYRTVEETYSALATLAANNPTLATWSDIGNSWHKLTPGGNAGYDIYALKLTNNSRPGPKPKFLLLSAIHAREYTTAELATRFAEELIAKYNVDPDVTWLLDHYEVHLIPQANPDGRKLAEGGQLWRKNTDNDDGCRRSNYWGTDLNRNSSFKWNTGGSSGNACNDTYRGPGAKSEPETQAIETYAAGIFPDQRGPLDTDAAPATTEGVFISLHSYSELVLFPWGWTTSPAPNSAQLRTLGRKFGFFNGYQVCNGPTCLYATSGTTDDYTYGAQGVASYTFELGTAFFQSCSVFTSNIIPKNMPALYYALKSARRPYQTPAGPDALTVAVSAGTVSAGTPVNLTATINDTRYNSNGWGTEPTQTIQAARYSIDNPSWVSGTTVTAMAAGDGVFNTNIEAVTATINTTGLSAGCHTLFVEGQDANGNWGPPTAVFLTIN